MGEGMIVTITPVALPIERTATFAVDEDAWREFWMQRRDALLREVDAIERALCINPRTAQVRRQYRMLDKAP